MRNVLRPDLKRFLKPDLELSTTTVRQSVGYMKRFALRQAAHVRCLIAFGCMLAIMRTACPAQSVGPITSYQKTAHGIEGRSAHGSFAVSVYSEHIVRVQVSQKDQPDNFSYSLVNNDLPHFAEFSIKETTDGKIVL